MSKESQYLQQVIAHEIWHSNLQGSKPEDLSCIVYFPVDTQQVLNKFEYFWRYWAQPRCLGSLFNHNTLETFRWL